MACHTEAEWKQIKMVQEQVNVKLSQDTGEVMWRQVKANGTGSIKWTANYLNQWKLFWKYNYYY